jgi:4-hydroxy-tetrahydrodipicolinate synthase
MKPIAGAWPTMVTPFKPDLTIDVGVYRQMIEWYLAHRVGGLYANCLSSEMFHLLPEERLLLAREAVKTADGRCPVAVTGNLGQTFDEQVVTCQKMADTGADIVMLVVPADLNTEDELERYYIAIAEQVQAPLGLYECPVPRGFHLSLDLVRRLAQTGRFVAYKETSCDLDKILALLDALRCTPLALMQANTPYMLAALRAGAPGSMTIAAIWLPDLVAQVIEKARAVDPAVESLHANLCAMKLAQRQVHPVGSKYLLSRRGVPIGMGSRAASPLRPETLVALDYAARAWLDEGGNLRCL